MKEQETSVVYLPISSLGRKKFAHPLDESEVAALASAIADVGLLQPVTVDQDGNLIFGFKRVAAFERLGRDAVPVLRTTIEKGDQQDLAVVYENLRRHHCSPGEQRALVLKAAEIKARQGHSIGSGGARDGAGAPKKQDPAPTKGAEAKRTKRQDGQNQTATVADNPSDGQSVKPRRERVVTGGDPGRKKSAVAAVHEETGIPERTIRHQISRAESDKAQEPPEKSAMASFDQRVAALYESTSNQAISQLLKVPVWQVNRSVKRLGLHKGRGNRIRKHPFNAVNASLVKVSAAVESWLSEEASWRALRPTEDECLELVGRLKELREQVVLFMRELQKEANR